MYHYSRPPRSSSPIHKDITYVVKDIPAGLSINVNDFLDKTGDSTRSLLAPLNNTYGFSREKIDDLKETSNGNTGRKPFYPEEEKTYEDSNFEEQLSNEKKSEDPESQKSVEKSESRRLTSHKSSRTYSRQSYSYSSNSSSSSSSSLSSTTDSAAQVNRKQGEDIVGKSWDNWLREKVMDDLLKLKLEKEKQQKKIEEKTRLQMEKGRQEKIASENRREWVQKKLFEIKKEKRENVAQKEYEKLKKQQEKEITEQKSKEKYEEWCAMKRSAEKIKKRKLKKDKKAEEQEKLNKKASAESAYKHWLRDSRKASTPHLHEISGSLLQYLHKDKLSTVSPGYINPLPWVSVPRDEQPTRKTSKAEMYSSPPMLWKEVEERRKIKKYSCSKVVAY